MVRYTPHRIPYVAALDGIRAIAILGVLVYHVRAGVLPGGFAGVDVFFVLSGYLIGAIALRDIRAGAFSFKEFYLRRVQRLLPNAVATIAVVLLLWRVFMSPFETVQPAKHALWTLANLSNFYAWRQLGGYWGVKAATAPLTHFWSLGVEEQFYLVFPGLLWLLARWQPRHVRGWLIGGAVVSFAGGVVASQVMPSAAFYLLPTRAWELLLGAILAAGRAPTRDDSAAPQPVVASKGREIGGWIGLGSVAAGLAFIHDSARFPGWMALVPTLGTVLVIQSVTQGGSTLARLLGHSWLTAIGRVSYSLYLWHWPLIILGKILAGRHGYPETVGAVMGGIAGVGLGVLAYVVVERPLRATASDRWRRLTAIGAGYAAVVVACGLVVFRHTRADGIRRWDTVEYYGVLYSEAPGIHFDAPLETPYVHVVRRTRVEAEAWRTGGIIRRYGAARPQVVVFGSSYALMFGHMIEDLCRERRLTVAYFAANATSALFNAGPADPSNPSEGLDAYDAARRHWLREWHPATLFLSEVWADEAATPSEFDQRLRGFLREVSPWVGQVVFVTEIPRANATARTDLRTLLNTQGAGEATLPRIFPDSQEAKRQAFAAVAEAATADFPNLRVLRADRAFYETDGSIRYAAGRAFFYLDNAHLSEVGAEQDRALFAAALEAGAAPAGKTGREAGRHD